MDTKKIIVIEDKDNSKEKKINCEKEKKYRVETQSWGLNENELSHDTQLKILLSEELNNSTGNKYINKLTNHIKNKIYNYKQQDINKNKYNENDFVSFDETIELLRNASLKCHYCSESVYILYELVREKKQWSLDRINNDIGHNKGNLVIACLECNLKRRRTNKDAFMFTKNMVIIKEDYL